MAYGLIFKKTSTCRSNPDIEYLDETSDYKLKYKAEKLGVSLSSLKENNQNVLKSVAYLTKEEHGKGARRWLSA